MRIIRAADCRSAPWKNGGGSTTEIAASPESASLETFDLRISMARVASDGPFSDFSGIDRTLAVIKGSGMVLTIGNQPSVTMSRGSEPVSFPGDTPTSARLTAGEITDLNVMTRRGRFGHCVQRIMEPVACDFADDDIAVLLSLDGETVVSLEHANETLGHGDAAMIDRAAGTFRISSVAGDCYLIMLREQQAS
jgi:environmental stress-induced protein Ves